MNCRMTNLNEISHHARYSITTPTTKKLIWGGICSFLLTSTGPFFPEVQKRGGAAAGP